MDLYRVTHTDSPYTLPSMGGAVLADCSDGDVTLILPDNQSSPLEVFFISRRDASANNLTVQTQGADMIKVGTAAPVTSAPVPKAGAAPVMISLHSDGLGVFEVYA